MATVDVADTEIMAAAPDDWRRRGQEDYLLSLELTWKRYQALSAEWEHEHCAFCFQKFTDPAYGPQTSQAADDAAHDQTHAGYTNLQAPTARAGRASE